MELREESVKIVYEGKEPVGLMKQNGTLKFYKLTECSYSDIDSIFNARSVKNEDL